jgi:hypothetical protein
MGRHIPRVQCDYDERKFKEPRQKVMVDRSGYGRNLHQEQMAHHATGTNIEHFSKVQITVPPTKRTHPKTIHGMRGPCTVSATKYVRSTSPSKVKNGRP